MKVFNIEITQEEINTIAKKYFSSFSPLVLEHYPRKLKKKIAVIATCAQCFRRNKIYTEKQVNEILKGIYFDYVTLRRDLCDAKLIDREADGSKYWLREA